MKPGDIEYQALVEKKCAEIREFNNAGGKNDLALGTGLTEQGNHMHKVTQLSESECAKEIEEVTGGSFTGKGGEVFDYKISPDGKEVTIKGTDRGAKHVTDGPHELPEAIRPKKRGRPKGSKNRPK